MLPRVRLLALIPVVLLASCGPPARLQLPAGNRWGDAPNDESELVAQLTAACPRIPVTARLRVDGNLFGRRVHRSLWVGTDSMDMRLEGSADGGAPFVLWGSGRPDVRRAGLWLPREGKVVVDADLRALASTAIGVPLDSLELYGLLTTCPMFDNGGVEVYPVSPNVRQLWIAQSGSHSIQIELYRRTASSPWWPRSVTVTREGLPRWRAEFSSPLGAIAATLRLTRLEWTGEPSRDVDLRLAIDRPRVDMSIGPGVLTPSVPPSHGHVTLADVTSSRGGRPVLADGAPR